MMTFIKEHSKVCMVDIYVRDLHFDRVKESLIILWVIGHFLLCTLSENFTRHLIYLFHNVCFLCLKWLLLYKKISFEVLIKK